MQKDTPTDDSARRIAEDLLARTGHALVFGGFGAFALCFHIPNLFETINGLKEIRDASDLQMIYDNVRLQFRRMGVTRLHRQVIAASYRDESTVVTTHQSRLFHGTQLLQTPYPVFSVLTKAQDHGIWRIASSVYGLESGDIPRVHTADALGRGVITDGKRKT